MQNCGNTGWGQDLRNRHRFFRGVVLLVGFGMMAGWRVAAARPASEGAQSVPADHVLSDRELMGAVKPGIEDLEGFYEARDANRTDEALQRLARYLKEQSARRYYFNWKNFPERFDAYKQRYPAVRQEHQQRAREHMATYAPETQWQLPFQNQQGKSVTAYELRHLARQQKSYDMALAYYYEGRDSIYQKYFVRQVADLNRAFSEGAYDDAGNGIYERYRAGRRVRNWLFCHHVYLSSSTYDWRDQILLIKTFLHHGAQLAKRTRDFDYGNHHTKGLVALFQIAAVFPDFEGTGAWRTQALHGLEEHLSREVNADGFQFERSVHYHKGDIYNYFRVYQLAKLNDIAVPPLLRGRLKGMFEALVKIAQPNRRAPVLQDDTDRPYAVNNELDDVMTIGVLLFEEPVFRYFSDDSVSASLYWSFRPEQLDLLHRIEAAEPSMGSIALKETGYYVTRNGWDEDHSKYMVISAGLSAEKPDHQHGEMLGVAAYANGHQVLPTYQVHYDIPDYRYWKSSWVKNVALVDSLALGRGWEGNEGGSGFGQWRDLPHPSVKRWISTGSFDYFAGAHDSYEDRGVDYERSILFVKDAGFWIVQDHFQSGGQHTYQQIWQGHYTTERPGRHVRSSFEDGTGLDVLQLGAAPTQVADGGRDGKEHVVFATRKGASLKMTTLVYPFERYEEAVESSGAAATSRVEAGGWVIRYAPDLDVVTEGWKTDAQVSLIKGNRAVVLGATQVTHSARTLRLDAPANLYVEIVPEGEWEINPFEGESERMNMRFSDAENQEMDVRIGDRFHVVW